MTFTFLGGVHDGVLISLAAGPGETQTTQATKPVTYNQQSVKALGQWEPQSNGTWVFRQFTGGVLIDSWIESLTEQGAYYYVGADGVMLINSKTPDGYNVDANGLWRQASGFVNNTQTGVRTETKPSYGYGDEVGPAPNPADYDNADDYYAARAKWIVSQPSYQKYLEDNMIGTPGPSFN